MKSAYPSYSTLFSTIYDEQHPIGHLGRGTHYSVLRCAEWFDVTCTPLNRAQIHDFAIIWDEDHDERVIKAIETIYMEGLLPPVQFIGERKGFLTVIVAAKFYFHHDESVIKNYTSNINRIANDLEFDHWQAEVGIFDRIPESHQNDPRGIIADDNHKIMLYIRNIDSLWNLGTKAYIPNLIPPWKPKAFPEKI
jgi:hypothetical protein